MVPTDVSDEVTTVELRTVPLRVPAGATTTLLLAAVIRPFPFTVKEGMEVVDPKEPVLEFTVARVAATDPAPLAVTSPVKAVM
jgi:hypothetical protein